jgi:hypothetical protein
VSSKREGGGNGATVGGPVVGYQHKLNFKPTVCAGGRAVNKRLKESTSQLKEDAVNAAKISVFVLFVLLGVLYVLDY